jgi:hypothetical protein
MYEVSIRIFTYQLFSLTPLSLSPLSPPPLSGMQDKPDLLSLFVLFHDLRALWARNGLTTLAARHKPDQDDLKQDFFNVTIT